MDSLMSLAFPLQRLKDLTKMEKGRGLGLAQKLNLLILESPGKEHDKETTPARFSLLFQMGLTLADRGKKIFFISDSKLNFVPDSTLDMPNLQTKETRQRFLANFKMLNLKSKKELFQYLSALSGCDPEHLPDAIVLNLSEKLLMEKNEEEKKRPQKKGFQLESSLVSTLAFLAFVHATLNEKKKVEFVLATALSCEQNMAKLDKFHLFGSEIWKLASAAEHSFTLSIVPNEEYKIYFKKDKDNFHSLSYFEQKVPK